MSHFDISVHTRHRRLKYPRRLNIASVEAAHEVALRLGRILLEGRSVWAELALTAQDEFTVEAGDEEGKFALFVPGRWIRAYLVSLNAAPSTAPSGATTL